METALEGIGPILCGTGFTFRGLRFYGWGDWDHQKSSL